MFFPNLDVKSLMLTWVPLKKRKKKKKCNSTASKTGFSIKKLCKISKVPLFNDQEVKERNIVLYQAATI